METKLFLSRITIKSAYAIPLATAYKTPFILKPSEIFIKQLIPITATEITKTFVILISSLKKIDEIIKTKTG